MFVSLDGPHACSPDQHYTDDCGDTFFKIISYIGDDGIILKEKHEVVTHPEKVEMLKDLWITYQMELGGPVFCP